MDYQALRAYIDSDPVFLPLIAVGDDQGIADIINARTAPVVGMVPRSIFSMWCGVTGLRSAIEDAAGTAGHPLRSIALTVLDFLRGGVSEALDFADSRNQEMLGAWVQAGALTQPQADELVSLATTDQPVFGYLHNLDIARAFGRMGVEP